MSGVKRKRKIGDEEIERALQEDSKSDYEDSGDMEDEAEEDIDDVISAEPSSSTSIVSHSLASWHKIRNVKDNSLPELDSIPDFIGKHSVLGFNNLEPYGCFTKFFPTSIFEFVANETNRYAENILSRIEKFSPRSRYNKWQDVNDQIIKAFVAVEIGMGLVHKPTLESYFQDTYWLTQTPGFNTVFKRDEYQLIRSFLHFSNNDDESSKTDRLSKIKPIIDLVKDTYISAYNSNKELCVDESMLKFKGHLYRPSKARTKWGIKIWSLCDSRTGFLLRFDVYTGKDSSQDSKVGLGARVVSSLLNGFEGKGHVVYTDNFYSSVELFESLRLKKIGACGTVRANRRGLPSDMRICKLKRGDLPVIWENHDRSMLACTWQDTGRVNMISTVGNGGVSEVHVRSKKGMRTVLKPNIQILYNSFMGGVDYFDQLCATYPFDRKSKKWYQTIWHFLIEVALVNGYICYNIQNPNNKLSQWKFREKVIEGLLDGFSRKDGNKRGYRMSAPKEIRLTERHFPRQFENKKKQPNCCVCSIMPSQCAKKGKGVCKRKQTTYYCAMCPGNPAMCVVPCFENYHSKVKYKKFCQCSRKEV